MLVIKTVFIDSMNMVTSKEKSIWEKFYNVMFNTGNLVFSEYCKKGIKFNSVDKLNKDWSIADKSSVYVLPLSNNLSPDDTYFTRMLYRLARYNLNIVPIGLGVQADLNETPKDYIKKYRVEKRGCFK